MTIEKVAFMEAVNSCKFLPNRRPDTTDMDGASKRISSYQQGAVYVAYFAGQSEWELHHCEEIVFVLEGEAQMFQIRDGEEISATLTAGEYALVPTDTWHRFSVEKSAKIMTVTTKQPSEYSEEWPV